MPKKQKNEKQQTPKSSRQNTSLNSPGTPKPTPTWTVCPFCGLKFSDADCQGDESFNENLRNGRPSPSNAMQIKVFQPEVGDDKPASWTFSKEPIFINLPLLRKFGATVGSPVVINNHFVGFFSVASEYRYLESAVGVNQQLFDRVKEKFQSEFVLLRAVPEPYVDAKEVHLSVLNADVRTMDHRFINFAKTKFLSEFVRVGTEKIVSYLGNHLHLRVSKLVNAKGETFEDEISSGFCVCDSEPGKPVLREFCRVVRETKVVWLTKRIQNVPQKAKDITCYKTESSVVEAFMSHAALSAHEKSCCHGLIVFGPHAIGKTTLVRAACRKSDIPVVEINAPLLGRCSSEQDVFNLLEQATRKQPCIIVIDRLDFYFSQSNAIQKGETWSYTEPLVSFMDHVRDSKKNVFFIGMADKLEDVHRDLRDATRFGIRVEMGYPSVQERCEVFEKQLESIQNNLSSSDIRKISEECNGFSLQHLVKVCATKTRTDVLTFDDLMKAVKTRKREIGPDSLVTVSPVAWEDIGGQQELKSFLRHIVREAVASANDHTKSMQYKGVLLYGPPGCCKTMVARAVATECCATFFAVQGPELLSKYVGESEKAIRDLFNKACKAAPSVIFFDEIDAIAGCRDGGENDVTAGVVSTLLTEIEGIDDLHGVAVIAATNRPGRIDPALLDKGRFGKHFYVRLPDPETRREILRLQFSHRPIASDVDLEELVRRSEGFSGAEVVGLCKKAALLSMIEDLSTMEIKFRHFLSSLDNITPLTDQKMLDMFENFEQGNM